MNTVFRMVWPQASEALWRRSLGLGPSHCYKKRTVRRARPKAKWPRPQGPVVWHIPAQWFSYLWYSSGDVLVNAEPVVQPVHLFNDKIHGHFPCLRANKQLITTTIRALVQNHWLCEAVVRVCCGSSVSMHNKVVRGAERLWLYACRLRWCIWYRVGRDYCRLQATGRT